MTQNYDSVYDAMMLYRSLVERDVFSVREGLTKQQEIVLIGIVMREPTSSSGLADYLSLPRQNVSRTVIELESQGLVTREVDPSNRRQIIITLSDKGREFVAKHRQMVRVNFAESFETLDESERDLLVNASRVAATLLRKAANASGK